MQIEMTGKEDRLSPWKYAIGGFPGSGKTLLASTAPNPLFVFFRENPRIKSIADRHIPHVKVLNDETTTVIEKMQALAVHLEIVMADKDQYETLVIDTGDELFNAMKEARREKNGGEWGPGDWSWLGDAYRAMMETFIDLDMRLIVNFHIKTSQEGDDVTFRELMLQGVAKDEAPGWFDVVGVLDTYEVPDEEGDLTTSRVLLTHSSRLYPWLKDHSGNMPRRWELTPNFIGDISSIEEVLNATEIHSERAILEKDVGTDKAEGDPETAPANVVTPEALEEVKADVSPEISKALDTVTEVLEVTSISDPSPEEPKEATVPDQPVEEAVDEPSPVVEDQTTIEEHLSSEQEKKEDEESARPEVPGESPLESQPQTPTPVQETPEPEPVTTESIKEEEKPTPQVCEVCGEEAPDDVVTVSKIRMKKVLCREHFRAALSAE